MMAISDGRLGSLSFRFYGFELVCLRSDMTYRFPAKPTLFEKSVEHGTISDLRRFNLGHRVSICKTKYF